MLDEFEVPRFHIFPIVYEPQSDIFPTHFRCKKLEKIKGLVSFALAHSVERCNGIIPVVATEYETKKQKTSVLLCLKLARTSKERRK